MRKASPFKWTETYDASSNLFDADNVSKAQTKLMEHLFVDKKQKSLSLAKWYEQNSITDLGLYGGLGLISPLEYNFFKNHLLDWELDFVNQYKEREEAAEIQDEKTGTKILVLDSEEQMPDFSLSNLIRGWSFDAHENLFLRLERPLKMMPKLTEALSMENLRTDKSKWISVLDELTCREDCPKDERGCWEALNQMVSDKMEAPFEVPLKSARLAMEKLNCFQIYRALADINDYAHNPVVKQRVKGKFASYRLKHHATRVKTALNFLKEKKMIKGAFLDLVCSLSPEKREAKTLELKRAALSAFLSDLLRASPDEDWLNRLYASSLVYFDPLFRELGTPVVSMKSRVAPNKSGKDVHIRQIDISFDESDSLKKISKSQETSIRLGQLLLDDGLVEQKTTKKPQVPLRRRKGLER